MSKTTKATNNVQSAQAIVDELEARKTEMAASRASDERELAEISFAAHGAGDQKALARLETIKARIVKREVDAKSLNAAVDEAKRRFADARNAEAMAEAARVAEEVAEIAGILRESGAEADKALARFIPKRFQMYRRFARTRCQFTERSAIARLGSSRGARRNDRDSATARIRALESPRAHPVLGILFRLGERASAQRRQN